MKLKDNGKLTIASRSFFFTPLFNLSKELPLDRIFVGAELVNPQSHNFSLPGKDRHGMAWADYNGDGQSDVFIVRGGEGGTMSANSLNNKDELLVQDNLNFKDRTAGSGLIKNSCPARQVSWVDFDRDNLIDIYVVCGRDKPPRQLYSNQLYRQKTQEQFVDIAAEKKLDILENGHFLWLDANNDGTSDLFWADNKAFWLYTSRSGQFSPQLIGKHSGKISQLTMSDYDRDGDLDLFAASVNGNTLLTNSKGIYKITNPKLLGLPTKSSAASWVDYDNDGEIDLHLLPDGIYRQRSDRRFEATHLLKSNFAKSTDVRSTWFDADNNGSRDLLIAIKVSPSLWQKINAKIFQRNKQLFYLTKWRVLLYRNVGANNRWSEIELVGPEGNHSGVGSRVVLVTADGTQMQQVGQAEGSRYSQGHYRLYYGLGKQNKIDYVKIFWSDGRFQELKNPASKKLLVISQAV